MTITLKKRFTAIAVALLLVIASIVTVNGFRVGKPAALSAGYCNDGQTTDVYYFSDSAPIFVEGVPEHILDKTFYDIHRGLSVAEFEFLVYGGYFMGFDDYYPRAVVVIQLATIKPSEQTLNDLFYCLHYQNCLVMFLSPFRNEYVNLNCDKSIPCPLDDYDLFLRLSVRSMYYGNEIIIDPNSHNAPGDNPDDPGTGSTPEIGSDPIPDIIHDKCPDGKAIPDNTVLFLDGRLLGIFDDCDNLDIRNAYMYSRSFRRLLAYMRYGYDKYDYNPCEELIYDYLWDAYTDLAVFREYEITLNKWDINSTISAWEKLNSCGAADRWNDFWFAYNSFYYDDRYDEVYSEFYDSYMYIIGECYYSEYVSYFIPKNMHIYAHAYEYTYFSAFELDDNGSGASFGCVRYDFIDCTDFLSKVARPIDYIYAIGIYPLKQEYYDFLYNFQKYVANNRVNLGLDQVFSNGVTVFLWSEVSFPEGPEGPYGPDGLVVVTLQGLKEFYGYDELIYDYYYWLDQFLKGLSNLIENLYI